MIKVIGLDPGGGHRIGGGKADPAPAFRQKVTNMQRQAIAPGQAATMVMQVSGDEVELQIRAGMAGVRGHKSPRLGHVRGEFATPAAQVGPGGAGCS